MFLKDNLVGWFKKSMEKLNAITIWHGKDETNEPTDEDDLLINSIEGDVIEDDWLIEMYGEVK